MNKIVVPIKIQTEREITDDLSSTPQACNAAANCISVMAWEGREFSKLGIPRLAHSKAKDECGRGFQVTVRTIAKVADDYNSGNPKFRRTRKRQFSWSSARPREPDVKRKLVGPSVSSSTALWSQGQEFAYAVRVGW
jgi:hypothetical protein